MPVGTREEFAAQMRAAGMDLVGQYAENAGVTLQKYPGRPRSLYTPTAFIDRMSERVTFSGVNRMSRVVRLEMVFLHGLFDSGDAVAMRDQFVDGFAGWAADRFHAAGANTTIGVAEIEDDPNYVPDWLPPEQQKAYYATRIVLEGLALD